MANKKSAELRAQRTQQLREAQRRKERNRQIVTVAAIMVGLALVVGLGFLVQSMRDTTGEQASTPSGTDGYGVVVGQADAPTTIKIYEDMQCPYCAQFEQATAAALDQGIEQGKIKVDYRMVSFLDGASSNEYSSRAMNAALVVLDTAGPEVFKRYHDMLYADQPAEGGPGPEDDELISMAVEAGAVESEIRRPIEDKVYEQWITNATDAMSQDDVTGTPTVFIDGELAGENPGEMVQAVLEAAQ